MSAKTMKIVSYCGDKYGFSVEEMLEGYNVQKKQGVQKKQKQRENKVNVFPWPYQSTDENLCKGIKKNEGLYTQCKEKRGDGFCTRCEGQRKKNESGLPDCGSTEGREDREWMDPKERKPMLYTDFLKKKGYTLEEAELHGEKIGKVLREEDRVVSEKKQVRRKNVGEEVSNKTEKVMENVELKNMREEEREQKKVSKANEKNEKKVEKANEKKAPKKRVSKEVSKEVKNANQKKAPKKRVSKEVSKVVEEEVVEEEVVEEEVVEEEVVEEEVVEEEVVEEEEEEEEVQVTKWRHEGVLYLKTNKGKEIYDIKTQELVGIWNETSGEIEMVGEESEEDYDEEESEEDYDEEE